MDTSKQTTPQKLVKAQCSFQDTSRVAKYEYEGRKSYSNES